MRGRRLVVVVVTARVATGRHDLRGKVRELHEKDVEQLGELEKPEPQKVVPSPPAAPLAVPVLLPSSVCHRLRVPVPDVVRELLWATLLLPVLVRLSPLPPSVLPVRVDEPRDLAACPSPVRRRRVCHLQELLLLPQ